MDKVNKVFQILDKDGGKAYLLSRFILDAFLMSVWILWSFLKVKEVKGHLCPPKWTSAHCSSEASREAFKQVFYIGVLIPVFVVYGVIWFMLRRRSRNNKKLSTFQTLTVILLTIHFYACFLWCFYIRALGMGLFIVLVLIAGMAADLALSIKFFLLRRKQKQDEADGYYSTTNNSLIAEI